MSGTPLASPNSRITIQADSEFQGPVWNRHSACMHASPSLRQVSLQSSVFRDRHSWQEFVKTQHAALAKARQSSQWVPSDQHLIYSNFCISCYTNTFIMCLQNGLSDWKITIFHSVPSARIPSNWNARACAKLSECNEWLQCMQRALVIVSFFPKWNSAQLDYTTELYSDLLKLK